MATTVTEIAPDVFRISTFHPLYGIQFNQFLVRDEEPFLMHTGFRKMFAATMEGVNEWLRIAPRAQAVSSVVGSAVMLDRELLG
jgi:flavorubredoxin